MTDHPSPTAAAAARPNWMNIRTTSHLLKQTTATFWSGIFTFLILSLSLMAFRTLLETGSHSLTSFLDADPTLRPLLSRLDLAGTHPHHPRPRRRPFFHLTRVGTIDDDFFSSDDDSPDLSPFNRRNYRFAPGNGTSVILSDFDSNSGFSNFISDNGIRVNQIVRPGFRFGEKSGGESGGSEKGRDFDSRNDKNDEESGESEQGRDVKLFVKGLELGRRDATALFFLVSFLSAAYGWVILGFTAVYSWVLGIVFVAVVNDLLGRFGSFVGIVWDGSRLGFKRLTGFILMRWAVRDALTQIVGLWYFGEVEDQYSFFKLFLRLKLMPFSVMSPWIRGFEKEVSGFLFAWFLLDTVVAVVFAVDPWVTIVDSRRTGREIVREGCYLISTMFNQAVQIKCFEAVLCGSTVRWVLTRIFGKFLASFFQSAMEVYFIVAWLIFYFAARSKEAHSEGRRFGRRELEGLIDGLR